MTRIPLPPLVDLSYVMPDIWDSTMIVSARECERRFLYEHANHLHGDGVSIPLHFGGAFAKGLEAYRNSYFNNSHDEGAAFLDGADAIINAWGDHPSQFVDPRTEKADKRTLDKCIFALQNYFVQWPIATDTLQPHINTVSGKPTYEFSFAVPLDEPIFPRQSNGEPYILTGRADTLGTYGDLPVIEDDKTTSAMGDKWVEQWYTRHQFMTYIWVLRKMGFKARHVIVRGICVRSEEIEFRETHPIHRPDHLLDKFEYELASTLYAMQTYFDAQQVPRRFGNACYSHFKKCQFWDVCATRKDFELPMLRSMKRSQWDPMQLSIVEEG